MSLLLAVIAFLQANQPPAVIIGWLPIVGFTIGALLSGGTGVYAWGKWTQTVNGFGDRVTKVEERLGYADARDAAMQSNIDRVLNQHSGILEKLGEAKKAAEGCSDDMERATHRIEAKIDQLRNVVTQIDKGLSERVAGLEATGRRLHHEG